MDLYIKIIIGALVPFLILVGYSLFRFIRMQSDLRKREIVTLSPELVADLVDKACKSYAKELDLKDSLDELIETLTDTIAFTSASYLIPVTEGSSDYFFKSHLVYEVSENFVRQNLESLTQFLKNTYEITPENITRDVEGGPITASSDIQALSQAIFPLEVGGLKGGLCFSSRKKEHFSEFLQEDLKGLLGKITGYLTMVWEVARREHGKFKAMVDSMRDGVFMVDEEYRFLIANPALKKMLGLYDAESVNIVRVSGFFARALSIEDVINEVFALGKVKVVEQIEIEERILELVAIPVKVRNSVIGVVCIVQDVTRDVELEGMRRDFSAMIIHELRSPLSVIRGTSDFLLKESDNMDEKQAKEFVQQIRTSSDNLLGLVNNLLDSAKIESGKIELFKENVNVNKLVEEETDYFAKSAEQKKVKLTVRTDPTVGDLNLDGSRIRQVLNNLISNALKFAGPDGVVLVGTKILGGNLRIFVEDTGKGIPDNKKEEIFEKYKQAKPVSPEKGTGLGLAISKGIVEAHGGKIWVEDNEPQGSRFIVELPA